MESSQELEITRQRRCTDLSVLQLKENERVEDVIVLEEWLSLQSRVLRFRNYCAGKRAETLTRLQYEVVEQLLRDFRGTDP